MDKTIRLRVDGRVHDVHTDPDMPLLYALRDDLGFENPRFGCGLAQCGACTVHIDGRATRSCVTPVSAAGGRSVTTLAGLGTPEHPHPLQPHLPRNRRCSAGYCLNGWIMTAADLLQREKRPTKAQIKEALDPLICRCGSHVAILRAVERASKEMPA